MDAFSCNEDLTFTREYLNKSFPGGRKHVRNHRWLWESDGLWVWRRTVRAAGPLRQHPRRPRRAGRRRARRPLRQPAARQPVRQYRRSDRQPAALRRRAAVGRTALAAGTATATALAADGRTATAA